MAENEEKSVSKAVETRLLDTLVANTESLTSLGAVISNHSREYSEGQAAARQHANSMAAKIENLDRSVSEIRLSHESGEQARQMELKRIFDLLGEERKDRRDAVSEGRDGEKSTRELLRELISEELGERRETRKATRNMIRAVSTEVWKVGGKYIVAAVALLVVFFVMKVTNMSLADILGLVGK